MKLNIDPFILALLCTVAASTLAPCRGVYAVYAGHATTAAVALLFLLHGAKLSREAIVGGWKAWKIHSLSLSATYIMFPVLGLIIAFLARGHLNPAIGVGILFLCLLPSTVQSSIAFTAIAGGNVPAAICSASASNLLGVFATPLLVQLLMGRAAQGSLQSSLVNIALLLLAPFAVGHLLRPVIGSFLTKHKPLVGLVDRGSILLVVYTAFSAAVVQGLWSKVSVGDLAWILAINAVLLAIALTATTFLARRWGLSTPDQITAVFCGSKKSLASGVPMASVLFPAALVGPMIMPLMIFHQMQLMACAVLSRRYAARAEALEDGAAS